jgi:GNAT superfamily N-acetyltransferase
MQVRSSGSALLLFSGSPIPVSNFVISHARVPDPEDMALLAAEAADLAAAAEVPWSIVVRSDPTQQVLETAAEYGLTRSSTEPFLTLALDGRSVQSPELSGFAVSAVAEGGYDAYVSTLSTAFGVPLAMVSRLFSPAYLGTEEITVYVGTVDGVPVVTGMGQLCDGFIGVAAIATRPEFRKRGYGQRMVERIMDDGYAAGARVGYLRSTDMALPLYEAMGFRTAEHWTTLSAQPS